jgi:hypothetical protein
MAIAIPPRKPKRKSRTLLATTTKETDHNSDIEIIASKLATKQICGFKKRQPPIPQKQRIKQVG